MKLYCSIYTRPLANSHHVANSLLAALILLCAVTRTYSAENPPQINFAIEPGCLLKTLRKFSEQSSLQLLYAHNFVIDKHSESVIGVMTAQEALSLLLDGTGLDGRFINDRTVAISVSPAIAKKTKPLEQPEEINSSNDGVTVLMDVEVTSEQPWWLGANNESVLGFAKPLLETPRSVSSISGDAIEVFSLSAVEDLLRVVPGVFTTTRFGVQGSVDIRSVPADTYFRGMKRLTLQGHGRSVLAAMDTIDVVGGPASPLLGIGKFGGYVNFVPKSGRSATGQYLKSTQGFAQVIAGEYDRRELSFGFGGPLSLDSVDKQGGYYIYGLVEDSDSYAQGVPVKQNVFQAATSVDDMVGAFRLEAGVNYQESRTAGALTGRFTQDLVDRGNYISGSPLVNLDLNGNGKIGFLEMQMASPVVGNLVTYNQPLQQIFSWPTDGSGRPLMIDQFPKIAGIPQSMFSYLQANPDADPTGLLRAQGVGGPLPVSGGVPVGMVLDPRTVTIKQYNPQRSAAFEKDLEAKFFTAFADFVYDEDPDFTIKNQLFFDKMNQYKSSDQPFSQIQDVEVIEDKFTIGKRINAVPSWLAINTLISFNLRNTVSSGKMTLGDYGNHRTDAATSIWNERTGGMTANTTFTSSNDNVDLTNDGLPWARLYRTEYSEIGVGLVFDVDLFTNTNLLMGIRVDGSEAENIDYAGRYQYGTGTSANPGAYIATDDIAKGWDSGTTWSVSVSHQLPYGVRPYATLSKASIILDGNNNSMSNTVIEDGHFGRAELKEAGIKAGSYNGRFEITTSFYQQGRIDADAEDSYAVINAYATSTTTEGWQTEIKWAPVDSLLLSAYLLKQETRYTPNTGASIQLDARALGFVDVLDANGNVVYPAEAFLYGGRARITLPDGIKEYEKKQGNPETQAGMTAIYQLSKNWGLTFKGNYLSSTCTGRLCLVELSKSLVFDAGLFWNYRSFGVNFDVTNITDEEYFRSRTGDTLGDVIAQAMPGRTMQLTLSHKF